MKIVHVSDIHIRNVKYHDEYRRVFRDLYDKIGEISPDMVVNTGDTAHTKVQISPEFVQMCSEHVRSIADLAPYHILLGNHDLNLSNLYRQDAISPIVDSVRGSTGHEIFLHKQSGVVDLGYLNERHRDGGCPPLNLWAFSCADRKNYPTKDDWSAYAERLNIGLYHGSVKSAITDSDWEMKETDVDVEFFKGLDFVLLGDIHRHQFLDREKRIAYAGSLIQQNFGEDPHKGFLLWDIRGKDDWEIKHIELNGSRRFYTVRLNDDFSIPDDAVAGEGSRIRVMAPKPFTLAEQRDFEKTVRDRFKPLDVLSIAPHNIGEQGILEKKAKMANLRDLSVQEDLIRKFLTPRNLSAVVLDQVFDINRRFQIVVEKEEEIARNVSWRIDRIAWNNMFNYGEGNVLDFSKIRGVTGLFAPNSAGKSSLIDVIAETLFDKTTKDVSKNLFLINDNKHEASMVAEVVIGEESFVIERTIEKVKYGQRKFDESKEWGKTSLNFYNANHVGDETESLNGQLRPETERNIRRHLGTYEDFVLTSLLAQGRDMDIIKNKETDRRKILYKFMDLDIFEQKWKLAKDESKVHFQKLKEFDDGVLERVLSEESMALSILQEKFEQLQSERKGLESRSEQVKQKIEELLVLRVQISDAVDVAEAAEALEDAQKELARLGAEEAKAEAAVHVLQGELRETQTSREVYDLQEHREVLESAVALEKDLQAALKEESKFAGEIKVWNRDIEILRTVPCGDSFPTCRFLKDAFQKKSELPQKEDDGRTAVSRVEELQKQLDKLDVPNHRAMLTTAEKLDGKIRDLRSKLQNAKLKKDNCTLKVDGQGQKCAAAEERLRRSEEQKAALEKNLWIDGEVKKLKGELRSKLGAMLDILSEEITTVTKEIGGKENLLQHLTSEVAALRELKVLCDAYEHYTEAMGKHGIAYQILVEKLPLLNDEINKILSSVADFNVFIEHDPEEQSIRLYLQYGSYRGRLLELGGGAEKMLASIALRAALLSITSLPKSNLFIIDEGFGSLDSRNLDNINRMFDYLRSVFDHVLIISHLDALKDMVDNNIEITVDEDKYSKIEVV